MVNSHFKTAKKITSAVLEKISKSSKSLLKAGLEEFTEEFYKFVPAEDLSRYKTEELCSIVLNAFEFFKERKKGGPKIKIFNPTMEKDGWTSDYTIIEMINDDKPFIVDSIIEELTRHDLKIYLLSHPVIHAVRDKAGNLTEVAAIKGGHINGDAESVIHLQVSHISDKEYIKKLEAGIERVLNAIKVAVEDWHDMLQKANYSITELSASAVVIGDRLSNVERKLLNENTTEIKEFLEWLKNGNFVFLGYIEYNVKNSSLEIVRGSELGILKLGDPEVLPRNYKEIQKNGNPLMGKNQTLLEITKANKKSLVHRPVHMDYIGIKRVDEHGNVVGEHRFIGLFTSKVYYQSAQSIPIIRQKIESVRQRSGFSNTGHSGKALAAILEDFPRDELLQSSEAELFEASLGIVILSVQPKVRLFLRKDELERFVSCIIFIPRDRMSTELRRKMEKILVSSFKGTIVNHYTQIAESHLARVQIIVKTKPGKLPDYSLAEIEKKLEKAARLWSDDFEEELYKRFGEKKGEKLFSDYKEAFSVSYQNRFSTEDAYYDILQIEKVIETGLISFDLYESLEGTSEIFEFKVYSPEAQISLSKIMPIMENMGLNTIDEHTYLASPTSTEKSIWIHRFRFSVKGLKKPKLNDIKKNFENAVFKTWFGEIQNDALNKLILISNLKWRDVVLLRAYSKYLQQSDFSYSQTYIQESLGNHPTLVKNLVELFYSRFDPEFEKNRDTAKKDILAEIEKTLGNVSNLAEDRIIRGFIDLILATNRTNYFQKNADNNFKDYVSFKLNSKSISWLPEPKPYAEIFVYSSRVEGIHLRGGKVARGGLRWSDRREDFRTEVLGLMKAQMTKNSVIIPVGSKGGFVVKQPPLEGGREAFMNEGIECYKTFLRGLLDITDNLSGGKTVAPKMVVRHDGDDPYLVVAADKGTATFSDIANSVAAEYNFWLGDAFASGGSVGYDHKKMGITARGAWISVERHFREMGVDVSKDDFTVVGIGDMSGDVFGNGLLMSKHIKMVAAFNHLHIFIDPNPNPAESFKERQRMFKLPRSTWADYNATLISKGGGIFERKAKSIKLTKEIQTLLDITSNEVTPDELIKYILTAKVDLLWNGGIGTYVKSKSETNEQVGDKTNDSLRINGGQLRAKVIGEGGNLGFTQLGRIEYALNGGHLNTDAIDNSAGVDCSDHEVNIKIALGQANQAGRLTIAARNKLLETMTDEVAELVLQDNRLQTQALTVAQLQGNSILEILGRFISALEKDGLLNRAIEFLPNKDEINRRNAEGKGLTRPELSVVMAYSKIVLYEDLLKSNLPDDAYYKDDLVRYFPEELSAKFMTDIEKHPLRREIIATSVTNSLINRIGAALFYHIKEDTGVSSCDIARAYTVTREIFDLRTLWEEVSAIKGVNIEQQKELFMEIQNIVERTCIWFIRHYPQPLKIADTIKKFAPGIKDLHGCLSKVIPASLKEVFEVRLNRYKEYGLSNALAEKIAGLEIMSSACDIVQVASQAHLKVSVVAKVYFELGTRLNLGWIRRIIGKMSPHSYWQRISYKTLVDELFDQQRRLTSEVIKDLCNDKECGNSVETWANDNAKHLERYDSFINDLKVTEEHDSSTIIIALRKVKEICAN